MKQIFSIVLDIHLKPNPTQLKNQKKLIPVIPSTTLKAIQNSLENSIEFREPLSDDVIIKICTPEQIKSLSFIEDFYKEKHPSPITLNEKEELSKELIPFFLKNEQILFGSQEASRHLTKYEAQKMRIFPLEVNADSFVCAMTTQDPVIINKLRLRTGKKITAIISPLRIILNSIEKAYQPVIDIADRNELLFSLTK